MNHLVWIFVFLANIFCQETTTQFPVEDTTTSALNDGFLESSTGVDQGVVDQNGQNDQDNQGGINPLILQMGQNQEQDCGLNEVLNDCGNLDCEFKCGEEEESCDQTRLECFAPQCQCEMGYRRTAYGRCVLRELCD
ncbi:unnamed protein product, partial [Mesorhabditis belari]|uniref:TIL domain-containing protein n=1 Tax=Mesorhabditis belari TaxID=2138241 RepID=A0AAF3EFY1_9BILA